MGGPTPPGPTGPGTVAPNQMAQKLRGYIWANMGMEAFDKAIGMFGSKSEEGQAVMKALLSLRKVFSAPTQGKLAGPELKLMAAQQGGMGGGGPMPMPGAGAKGRLQSLFGGGGMPGGGMPSGGMTPPTGGAA